MDRSQYLRDYRQKMRGRVKRASLTFSLPEYLAFERAAAAAGEKPASHIKALALQALSREVVFPAEIGDELAQLSHLIRTIANNVNQMARHSHHIAHVLDENEPLAELVRLENLLKDAIKKMAKAGE
jgi:hypothetical protein